MQKAGHVQDSAPESVIDVLLEEINETTPKERESTDLVEVAATKLYEFDNITANIAKLLAEGQSSKTIATIVDLPLATVIKVSRQKAVKEYIKAFHAEVGMLEKTNRELLLSQVLEARLANLDDGDDLGSLTNKDTLDIIETLDRLQKEREKAELGTNQNTVINVLQAIRKD